MVNDDGRPNAMRDLEQCTVVLTQALPANCYAPHSFRSLQYPEPLVGGVKSALIGDQKMRETHSQSKYQVFLEGAPAFSTVIESAATATMALPMAAEVATLSMS